MTQVQIRINQLKQNNRGLLKLIEINNDNPNAQNELLDEIKLNEKIIKFLETL